MTRNISTKNVLLAAAALGTVMALSAGPASAAGDKEKCYGVAAAGKNDCATATSSCAGTSKVDNQSDAFVAVPKGLQSRQAIVEPFPMSPQPPRDDVVTGSIRASAGIGLRFQHVSEIIETKPDIPWLEAHAENHMSEGGRSRRVLDDIRRDYPISIHGVGLSIGGVDALDRAHLERLRDLVARIEPGLVSEHLAWCNAGGAYLNDLLPLPYTEASLASIVSHVDQVQDVLQRTILIENPSLYLAYACSELTEPAFLNALAQRTGCGILLDVNNVYVSAGNLGSDPQHYLDELDLTAVGEIHLAGHHRRQVDGTIIRIDDHGSAVSDEVWQLYDGVIQKTGGLPTLIEWDRNIPALSTLLDERDRAERMLASRNGHGGSDAVAA
jgi:uncharacterized protein (UPF0276 family)/uncharacterized membrane protein